MIIQEAKKILEKHLGKQSVKFIDERTGIFRCTKEFEHQPYQVLYVDCSNIWISNDFNEKQLEDYQAKTLLKDYYSQPGSLQWNYYYAFVSKAEEIRGKEDKKKSIEADELYTRKLVLTTRELDEWLSRIVELSKPSESLVQKDLASTWIKKLQQNELDAIFLDTKITVGVKHYMEGKPIIMSVQKEKTDDLKPDDKTNISFLEYLKLDNYRPHPERKEFNFGKVNLIKGVNGTGKTSLLESIELLLCGKSYRNPDENVTGYSLQARIKGNNKSLTFRHNDLRLFKNRDKFWYNNAEQKFNRIHNSFNKYNYYNSDAAFLLSNNPDIANVRKAFEDIALGEDVNRIETRLQSFKESFNKEYRLLTKQLKDTESERLKEEKLLKEISAKNQEPEQFLVELVKEAKSSNWIIKTGPTNESDVKSLEKDLINAQTYLQSINFNLKWSDVDSQISIERLLEEYTKKDKELSNIQKEIIATEKRLDQNDGKINKEKEARDILKQLSLYYKNSRINELLGLNEKIQELSSELSTLRKAKKLSSEIDEDALKEIQFNSTLSDLELSYTNQIRHKESEIRKLSEQQRKLTAGFDQLEKVINEIKSKGKEFLQLNSQATECPLCHTEYNYTQLVKLISKSKNNLQSSQILNDLTAKLQLEKKALQNLELLRKNTIKLKQIAELLLGEKDLIRSITLVRQRIEKMINSLVEKEDAFKKLNDLFDHFNKSGIDEDEFFELLEEASLIGIKIKNAEDFVVKNEKNKANLQELQKKSTATKAILDKLQLNKNNLLTDLGIPKKNLSELTDRLRKLNGAIENIALMKKLINLKRSDKFSAIETKVAKIQGLLSQYREVSKQKQEYDLRLQSANQKIKDLAQIEKNTKLFVDRSFKAGSVIDELLTKHSKSEYLKSFIASNKEEIVEIFKMIHSPKEFDDLSFSPSGNVSLRRKQTNKNALLTQISTGQRSALSLSIFSALNRKLKNGPNILMFDDPVINVDDLNVLSYFDYLREVAINGNRQIFFATANENVAFLFSQKFKFLEEGFVTIELSR